MQSSSTQLYTYINFFEAKKKYQTLYSPQFSWKNGHFAYYHQFYALRSGSSHKNDQKLYLTRIYNRLARELIVEANVS